MSNCTSGCKTKSHGSYAECLKDKNVGDVGVRISNGFESSKQQKWDRDLDAYADARRQGIQPKSTSRKDTEAAVAVSDKLGNAFDAGLE